MSFAEEFEKLKTEFEQHSASRVSAMQNLADALGREPGDQRLIEGLRVHFHAFAGLGTTYGRPMATALGERGEDLMADIICRGTTADDVAAIHQLIKNLGEEFRSAPKTA